MKINKLLYISHGISLAYYNKPLFKDRIEAWMYGPVVISVNNALRSIGTDEIIFKIRIDIDDLENNPEYEHERDVLDSVWYKFKNYSGDDLIKFTTKDNSPWFDVMMRGGFEVSLPITDSDIAMYFLVYLRK